MISPPEKCKSHIQQSVEILLLKVMRSKNSHFREVQKSRPVKGRDHAFESNAEQELSFRDEQKPRPVKRQDPAFPGNAKHELYTFRRTKVAFGKASRCSYHIEPEVRLWWIIIMFLCVL